LKKSMPDEKCADESIRNLEKEYKVEVIIVGLDVTLEQLHDRFTDHDVAFLREMHHFSPASFMSSKEVTSTAIETICNFYGLDASVLARERNAFAPIYRSMAHLIDVSDLSVGLMPTQRQKAQQASVQEAEGTANSDKTVDDNDTECEDANDTKWIEHSFVKPMRALEEISSFSNLLCLFKILTTVAMTSCGAERVMSRVKIIKNRLRIKFRRLIAALLTIIWIYHMISLYFTSELTICC